jgi:hypothetical protein
VRFQILTASGMLRHVVWYIVTAGILYCRWSSEASRTHLSCISVSSGAHNTPIGTRGERRYSSYSFTTSALDGGEWSASRFGRALPLWKGPPVPIVQEAGWAPEPVWTQRLEEKSFAPAGDRTSIALSSSP